MKDKLIRALIASIVAFIGALTGAAVAPEAIQKLLQLVGIQ